MQCLLGTGKTLNAQYFRFSGKKIKMSAWMTRKIILMSNIKCTILQPAALPEGCTGVQRHPCSSYMA